MVLKFVVKIHDRLIREKRKDVNRKKENCPELGSRMEKITTSERTGFN